MVYYLFLESSLDKKQTENYKPIWLKDPQWREQLDTITKDDIAVIECEVYLHGNNSIGIVQYLRGKGIRVITSFCNSLSLYLLKGLAKLPPQFIQFIFNEAISYDIYECNAFSIPYCIFPMDSNTHRKTIIDESLPETKVLISQTYTNSLLSKNYGKIIETANLVSFLVKEKVNFKNNNYLNESKISVNFAMQANAPKNVIDSLKIIDENTNEFYQKGVPTNFEIWSFPVSNYISDSVVLAIKHNKKIITTCQLIKDTPFYDPKFILVKDSFADLNQDDLEWINNKVDVKYNDGVDQYFSGDTIAKKILSDVKNGVKYSNNIFATLSKGNINPQNHWYN